MRITICVSLREKNKLTKMNVIRSRDHEIFTETVNKIALSSEDDKRVIKKKLGFILSHMDTEMPCNPDQSCEAKAKGQT